ncbi:Glycine/D-amino acid oxidase-like deaminating enzyme [Litorimonas haliclonae]
MVRAPKILVMGAGLIGLSTAEALQRRGAEVTVTDARSDVMHGTSYSNSGMIHPSQSRPWHSSGDESFDRDATKAVLRLAKDSQGLLLERFQSLGLGEALTRPAGCYQIFENSLEAQAAQEFYLSVGIEADLVSDAIKTLGHLALHFPADRSGDAYAYGRALQERLSENGAVFIYKASDLKLRQGRNGVTAQLRGHIFHCDHVVICTGPQSAEVLAQLGLSLPLTQARGFAVNFDRPNLELAEQPIMDAQSHSAMTVLGNTLRFSGTVGEASAQPLLKRWFHLAPDVMSAVAPAREIWSGLRPVSPRGRPYISGTSIPHLWVNTGHGHMGWSLCAGSGELMAEMIMDGKEDARFGFNG